MNTECIKCFDEVNKLKLLTLNKTEPITKETKKIKDLKHCAEKTVDVMTVP